MTPPGGKIHEPVDLLRDVSLERGPQGFSQYVETMDREQRSARAWFTDAGAHWDVPGGLRAKVDPEGRFRPLHGDTMVLPLAVAEVTALSPLCDLLHESLPDLLAERLVLGKFHLTLHDLSNGERSPALEAAMARNEALCREILARLAAHFERHPEDRVVEMVSTRPYPSVNTSVVMGFAPRTDRAFRLLLNAHALFDPVVRLSYWLRPHVTLAYFRPRPFDLPARERLARSLERLDACGSVPLALDLENLCYQHFVDMNTYHTLMRVAPGPIPPSLDPP